MSSSMMISQAVQTVQAPAKPQVSTMPCHEMQTVADAAETEKSCVSCQACHFFAAMLVFDIAEAMILVSFTDLPAFLQWESAELAKVSKVPLI